jgi:hypothetical protein
MPSLKVKLAAVNKGNERKLSIIESQLNRRRDFEKCNTCNVDSGGNWDSQVSLRRKR